MRRIPLRFMGRILDIDLFRFLRDISEQITLAYQW